MNDFENNQSPFGQAEPGANVHSNANETVPPSFETTPVTPPLGGSFEPEKNTPSSLVSKVKDKAATVASDQKDALADQIDGLANTVHASGDQFAGKQDWIAGAIEGGATELASLAASLRNNDLSSLLSQVKSLARKQPALFIGASLAAGFAIARLGKIAVADASRADLPTLPEVGHGNH